jgi:nitrogen fixation/metabolism regulation signal transduction histidine kinase
MSGGYLLYSAPNLQNTYIYKVSKEIQEQFIPLAKSISKNSTNLQTKRQRFLKRLTYNFNGIKITGALERFEEVEFKQFLSELGKQRITLSLKQQDEWEEYFNEYRAECRNFVGQIEATDKKIDRMVYALYGLTEEEVEIIEN